MRASRGTACAAVVGVLLVSGCSDGGGPEPSASTSSSSSRATPTPTTSAAATSTPSETASETGTVAPSPTVTLPVLPEAAKKGDAPGAEAFLVHWFAVANYAKQTGDTDALLALSEPGCVVCADLIAGIDETYDAEGHIRGKLWTVESAVSPPPDSDGVVLATVRVTQSEGAVVESGGAESPSPAEEPENAGMVLAFEGGSWVLTGIGTL